MAPIDIVDADFSSHPHGAAILALLDAYASDIAGGGQPLPDFVRNNLIGELKRRPNAHALLAFVDDAPAGLLIAFEGFSTFACQPLLNLHDVTVAPPFRGRGIARAMLQRAETLAKRLNCCKLTLEVLEGNTVAQTLYRSEGYAGYALDPAMGRATFWQKILD